MALRCDHCHKGIQYGHAVSHAKRRLRRIFKPNLQKLVVFLNGKTSIHVKFCTSCIKRLKKDGKLGNLFWKKVAPPKKVEETPKVVEKVEEVEKEESKLVQKKAKKPLDIESIVGKKK